MSKNNPHIFTSESVGEGHPDKVADYISDSILDACLAQDKTSRVACETLLTTGFCVVSGEITTDAYVDIPAIARETINNIGYNRTCRRQRACAPAIEHNVTQSIALNQNSVENIIDSGERVIFF